MPTNYDRPMDHPDGFTMGEVKIEPIADEKVWHFCKLVKDIIEKQEEERKLFRQMIMAIGMKGRSLTYDDAEIRRYDLLTAAGIKPDALSWAADRIIRRRKIKEKMDMERTLRDAEREKNK